MMHFVVEEGAARLPILPFVEHAAGRLLRQAETLAVSLQRARFAVPHAQIAAALRPFIDTPNPHTFMTAAATLGRLGREIMMAKSLDAQRARLLEDALVRIEQSSSGALLKGQIVAGVRDKKAGARIHALACLVGAYEELEARAQLERDSLRKKLGIPASA